MEIERKFLLTSLPNIKPIVKSEVFHGYISIMPEIRIDSYEVLEGKNKGYKGYFLTLKGNGDLSRKEIETHISEEFFNAVVEFIHKPLIHKSYTEYNVDGHTLECSVVDEGTANTFIYGEVEFASEEEAKSYQWPFEEAVDVTYDKSFKMKNFWQRTR